MRYKWLFLDSQREDHLQGFTVTEMSKALVRMGETAASVKLWDKGQLIKEDDLRRILHQGEPEYVVWVGADGWNYFNVLKDTFISKKINLWFDDPIMRTAGNGKVQDGMRKSSSTSDFKIFVWDRYWSGVLEDVLGVKSSLIHLSADIEDYTPAKTILSDDLVFIGNLHSPTLLWRAVNDMPKAFRDFVHGCHEMIKQCPGIIPSWDQIMQTNEKVMDKGDVKVWVQSCLCSLDYMQLVQCAVWHLSKNEARIRMLREASKIHPVQMFTETKQLHHASIDEIKGMIGEWNERKFKVTDTSGIKQECLGHLYHYGKIHLQATDPQSVGEGIPYRVFQTAASRRPLLTDWRKGWSDSFDPQTDVCVYQENNFGQTLEKILKEDLEGMADSFYARFLTDHTWEQRIEYIKKECDPFERSYLGSALYEKAMSSLESQMQITKSQLSNVNPVIDTSNLEIK